MDDNVTNLPTCKGVKADGTACERVVKASQEFCYSHDKDRAEERKANASKAAKSKPSAMISELQIYLRNLIDEVREEEIDRETARVISQIAGSLLKSLAEGRKQASFDELRHQVEEIQERFKVYEQRQSGGRQPWRSA